MSTADRVSLASIILAVLVSYATAGMAGYAIGRMSVTLELAEKGLMVKP